MNQTFLFAHPKSQPLMNAVLQELHSLAPFREGAGGYIRKGNIEWSKFSDGWPNLVMTSPEELRGNDVLYFASLFESKTLFEELAIMYALAQSGAQTLTIGLPYFPVGTNERVNKPGDIATAKTLWRILGSIPACDSGAKARILIYDIHALQEQFYPSDDIAPKLETAIPLLLGELEARELTLAGKFMIAFPDDGARKRFGNMFPGRDILICDKLRADENRIVTIKEGDPHERHVVIVDDLVMTGGTILELLCNARGISGRFLAAFYCKHVQPRLDHGFVSDLC